MVDLMEKLVEADFEDQFKPISDDENTKRQAERLKELQAMNLDDLQAECDDELWEYLVEMEDTELGKLYMLAMLQGDDDGPYSYRAAREIIERSSKPELIFLYKKYVMGLADA